MTAFLWGLYDQNVAINQIVSPGYTLCWAAKFLGERKIHFDSVQESTSKSMIKHMHKLLTEAHVTITYNGLKYDLPLLNQEFALHGMTPPAPSQHIDLLRTMRRQFRFPSNKLDYVCQVFGLGGKLEHKGMGLWKECMEGNPSSWRKMKAYNIQDVRLLEKLYHRLLPWIKGHPNIALYLDPDRPVCHNCGSARMHSRGYAYTRSGRYRQYQCQEKGCGTWMRVRTKEKDRIKTLTQVA